MTEAEARPLREQVASVIDAHPPLEDAAATADRAIKVMFDWLDKDFAPRLVDAEQDILRAILQTARQAATPETGDLDQ